MFLWQMYCAYVELRICFPLVDVLCVELRIYFPLADVLCVDLHMFSFGRCIESRSGYLFFFGRLCVDLRISMRLFKLF